MILGSGVSIYAYRQGISGIWTHALLSLRQPLSLHHSNYSTTVPSNRHHPEVFVGNRLEPFIE